MHHVGYFKRRYTTVGVHRNIDEASRSRSSLSHPNADKISCKMRNAMPSERYWVVSQCRSPARLEPSCPKCLTFIVARVKYSLPWFPFTSLQNLKMMARTRALERIGGSSMCFRSSMTRKWHGLFTFAVFVSSAVPIQGQASIETTQGSSSVRAPSATLALVIIGQIQFLAMLSLVDSTGVEDSWVLDFAHHLRFDIFLPLVFLYVLTLEHVNVYTIGILSVL